VAQQEVKNPQVGERGARRRWGRREGWALVLTAGFALGSAPIGWVVTDHLEQDNDFCVSCHLAPGVRLHAGVHREFGAPAPVSLGGVHGAARVESRGEDPAFRCIDCHGGTSPLGRARVKALAAKDAFWYVLGHFEEPDGMRWPLWDEDCAKCHARFDETAAAPWQSPRFHQLPVHNAALGVRCVECHSVHEIGGNPQAFFLHAGSVRAQCARCHSEYADIEEG
jgi:nitrate/TMAO reductase-like tetraheme cytochrome c subunit